VPSFFFFFFFDFFLLLVRSKSEYELMYVLLSLSFLNPLLFLVVYYSFIILFWND